ncbi:MAG: NAD(P)H-hydrate epimerase, partial [Treponema sp.]|nr:NAD(P)H-hydrate epimerase [Treponema sp.]
MDEPEKTLFNPQKDFRLLSSENASLLDKEAADGWGLSSFALVEAAGRLCSASLESVFKNSGINSGENILVCAGSGNNAADALVMLREFLNRDRLISGASKNGKSCNAIVLLSRFSLPGENTPRDEAVKALQAMGVPVAAWNGKEQTAELFRNAQLIIDGIAGTGIKKPLEGIPLEMLNAVNEERSIRQCRVVSIDIPSGAHDAWKPGMPVVHADFTLAVQPLKIVLYSPALRPFCGTIIPVTGIFPGALLQKYGGSELLVWEKISLCIPPVAHDAYKYTRGVCEIHAGKIGTSGAARLAAAGASAVGAGLIRLVLDDELY